MPLLGYWREADLRVFMVPYMHLLQCFARKGFHPTCTGVGLFQISLRASCPVCKLLTLALTIQRTAGEHAIADAFSLFSCRRTAAAGGSTMVTTKCMHLWPSTFTGALVIGFEFSVDPVCSKSFLNQWTNPCTVAALSGLQNLLLSCVCSRSRYSSSKVNDNAACNADQLLVVGMHCACNALTMLADHVPPELPPEMRSMARHLAWSYIDVVMICIWNPVSCLSPLHTL